MYFNKVMINWDKKKTVLHSFIKNYNDRKLNRPYFLN